MRSLLLAAAVAAMSVGCTGPLGPNNSVTTTAASRHSSEQTYRNLLRVMKECYPEAITIRPTYFPEAKEGEIDLIGGNEFGAIPFGTWTVKPAPTGSIVTQVRTTRRLAARLDATLPEWIEGNSRECPDGTRPDPRPPGSELNQNNMPVR